MTSISFETRGAAGAPVRCDLDVPHPDGALRAWVVLLHGFKGFASWGFFPDLARRLNTMGLATLRVDLSHNGTGRGAERGEFTRLDLFEQDRVSYRLADVAAACAAAAHHEPRLGTAPQVLFGHSLGGALALLAADRMPVRAVITLNAVASVAFKPEAEAAIQEHGHLDVPNARTGQIMRVGSAALRDVRVNAEIYDLQTVAARLRMPWLILHGDSDETVPYQDSAVLARASEGRANWTRIERGDHTLGCGHPFEGPTLPYEHAMQAMAVFLDRNVPASRDQGA